MATNVIALTDEQKIQILEGAKELLGPNGEHWTKSCWWGVKRNDEEKLEYLIYNDYLEEGQDFDDLDDLEEVELNTDYEVSRAALGVAKADEANVWCLMGALEESAYRLGIIDGRDASERLGEPISLAKLVNDKEQWRGWSIVDVNDNPNTTFEMVRDLIDERLVQLREEQ